LLILERVQVPRGQHPRVGCHHDVFHAVAVLEGSQHWDQGGGLGGVSGERVHLQREPVRGDQQPNHNLGVHPPLLAHPHFPEIVFVLGYEIQGGDVVEHQRQAAAFGGMGVRGAADRVTPIVFDAAPMVRQIVRKDGVGTPSSPRTRIVSAFEVGSTTRASIRLRDTSSSTESNPSRAYAPSRTSHNTRDVLPATVGAAVIEEPEVSPSRSNASWPAAIRSFAICINTASWASSCAEPI